MTLRYIPVIHKEQLTLTQAYLLFIISKFSEHFTVNKEYRKLNQRVQAAK